MSPPASCREQVRAYRELAAREPKFAAVLDRYDNPPALAWHDGGRTGNSLFAALVLHVISQHTSAIAAFRSYDGLVEALGGVLTPRRVRELGADDIRGCGLSAAKAACLEALADALADGSLDLDNMDSLDDETAIATLTAIPGIGLWTAQTFLLHNLKRPDILPAAELGIRTAIGRLWQLPTLPTPAEVRSRGNAWAPFRSYAAELLWRSLVAPGQPSDQKERALIRLRAVTGPVAERE